MSPNRSAWRPPACLSCPRHTKPSRTLEPPPFPTASAPSESMLFSSPSAASTFTPWTQAQGLNHFGRDLLHGLPTGLLPERCLHIMPPSRLVKFSKTFQTTQQRALNPLLRLLPAAPPQLLHSSVQKHGRNASSFDQGGIVLLHKSPAPEG